MTIPISDTARERFFAKVDIRAPNECWQWLGATSTGYGRFGIGGRHVLNAHRAAWLLAGNELKPRQAIKHTCGNPLCVNVAHLEIGRNKRQEKDGRSRRRGVDHPASKLTHGAIAEIREWIIDGEPATEIAKAFDVSETTIHHIKQGRHWNSQEPLPVASTRRYSNRGTRHYKSKISHDDVDDILALIVAGEKITSIAESYGVSAATISAVRQGKHWTQRVPRPIDVTVQKVTQIEIKISVSLSERIQAFSIADRKSVNDTIIRAIREYVARRELGY